jgi:hypothetical protein
MRVVGHSAGKRGVDEPGGVPAKHTCQYGIRDHEFAHLERPGEFETIFMEEVAKRIVEFWDLPVGSMRKLVFGGRRSR